MKSLLLVIVALALACCGCATTQSAWVQYLDSYSAAPGNWPQADVLEEITGPARTLAPPLPDSTPYDKSDSERKQYLAGFTAGWKSGVDGIHMEVTIVHIDKSPSWVDGYWTGVKAYGDPLIIFIKENRIGSNRTGSNKASENIAAGASNPQR